jgi:hypothetical protein
LPGESPADILERKFIDFDFEGKDFVSKRYRNVISGGYEIIRLTVELPHNQAKATATLRVQDNADIIFYSGHGFCGQNRNNIDVLNDPAGYTALTPVETEANSTNAVLDPRDWRDVSKVIFFSCSAFSMHDYNHYFAGREPAAFLPNDKAVTKWDQAIGSGNSTLLGFNNAAPAGPVVDTRVTEKFFELVKDDSQREFSWAEHWLTANATVDNSDSASALDELDRYWFIAYKKESRGRLLWSSIWDVNRRVVYVRKENGPNTRGWADGYATRDRHTRTVVNRLPDIFVKRQ